MRLQGLEPLKTLPSVLKQTLKFCISLITLCLNYKALRAHLLFQLIKSLFIISLVTLVYNTTSVRSQPLYHVNLQPQTDIAVQAHHKTPDKINEAALGTRNNISSSTFDSNVSIWQKKYNWIVPDEINWRPDSMLCMAQPFIAVIKYMRNESVP